MSKQENPVDYVLDRMVEAVLGENAHFRSHAEALGIPAETMVCRVCRLVVIPKEEKLPIC